MTKLMLGGFLLLALFSGSLSAQEPVTVAGKVALQSSGEGIPEAAITLCQDTGRQVVSTTEGATPLPSRDQIQSIRIPSLGEPGQITVTSVVADCPNARYTTTDSIGRFVFSAVEPGPYKVHAQRSGYLGESLRGSPPTVLTQSITFASQQAVSVSFRLIKGGVITGTIRDTNGKLVTSVNVQAVAKSSAAPGVPLASAQTDDKGQYRLFWLPPGEFQILVRPIAVSRIEISPTFSSPVGTGPRRVLDSPRYPLTYHPNVADKEDAGTIVLREGEEVRGIDVVLQLLP